MLPCPCDRVTVRGRPLTVGPPASSGRVVVVGCGSDAPRAVVGSRGSGRRDPSRPHRPPRRHGETRSPRRLGERMARPTQETAAAGGARGGVTDGVPEVHDDATTRLHGRRRAAGGGERHGNDARHGGRPRQPGLRPRRGAASRCAGAGQEAGRSTDARGRDDRLLAAGADVRRRTCRARHHGGRDRDGGSRQPFRRPRRHLGNRRPAAAAVDRRPEPRWGERSVPGGCVLLHAQRPALGQRQRQGQRGGQAVRRLRRQGGQQEPARSAPRRERPQQGLRVRRQPRHRPDQPGAHRMCTHHPAAGDTAAR